MGSRYKDHNARQGGGIELPNMNDPRVQMAMQGMAAQQKPPAFSPHDRRLRTAAPAMIPIPINGTMIVFPIGGFSQLQQGALMIAAGCSSLTAAEAVQRAKQVLAAVEEVEPIIDPGTGQAVRQVGPFQWEIIEQEECEDSGEAGKTRDNAP